MATPKEFIDFVMEQLRNFNVTNKKMFGEYLIYLNGKPAITVCDSVCYVKINDITNKFLEQKGFPYNVAKEHYVLDIENQDLVNKIFNELNNI